jgi:DNA-binding transcriptional regulator YbjK
MPTGCARTGKGEARRTSIVASAADLLLADGVTAVTHRAVAARAGVPLGATTYYFSSRDDLVACALDAAASVELERSRAAAGRRPPRRRDAAVARAAHVLDVVLGLERMRDTGQVRAYYERLLEAGRSPAAAAAVRRWQDGIVKLLADVLPVGVSARAVLALVDGFVVQRLGEGHLPVEALVRDLAAALPDPD